MRLAICALSAVLLSGCSWLGGLGIGGGQYGNQQANAGKYEGRYHSKKARHHAANAYGGQHNPCVVYSPQQPVPQGCNPASVTMGTAGGFPQQPNFGGGYGAHTSGGYGSHADVASQQSAHYQPRKDKLRKPRFRGSLSLGLEKSNSGSLLDYARAPFDPVAGYTPSDYDQGTVFQDAATRTSDLYTGDARDRDNTALFPSPSATPYDEVSMPTISFDDAYSTPARLAAGVEYIMSPKTTVFANAGYTHSEGESGKTASVIGTVYNDVIEEPLDAAGVPIPGAGIRNSRFIPEQVLAEFSYNFTDMNRYDLELGGRHYFDPIAKNQGFKTVTPFVGASVGASHYNAVSYTVAQNQLSYQFAFADPAPSNLYSEISGPDTRVDLYDSQWVPSGQLNAGMEWQVTPKTALAFETGVRIEGAREYSNGSKGDKNIAIPVTIRGSYNF